MAGRPKVLSNGTTVSHLSRGPNSEVIVVRPPLSEAGRGMPSAARAREPPPGDFRSRLSGKSEDAMSKKVVAAKRSSRGGLDVESSGSASGRKRYRETRAEHGGGGRPAAPPPPFPPPSVHPQAPRSDRSGGDAVESFEPPPPFLRPPLPPPPPPEVSVHHDRRNGKLPTPTSTPTLCTPPWRQEEDRIIITGYAELGRQWGAIASHLRRSNYASRLHRSICRTNLQVRHRWKALEKAKTIAETTKSVVINKTGRAAAAVVKTTERQRTVLLSSDVADRERRLEWIRSAREASSSSEITQKKKEKKPEGSSQASKPESTPVMDMPFWSAPLEEDPGGLLRLFDEPPARSEGPHFRSAGGHVARYYGTRRAAQHPPHASSTLPPPHAKDTDPKDRAGGGRRSCNQRRRRPPPPPQALEGPPHPPKSNTPFPSKGMSQFVTNVRNAFVNNNRDHGESHERALYERVLDAVCSFYFKEMPHPAMLSCMGDILRGYPDLFDQFLNVVSKELGGIRHCE